MADPRQMHRRAGEVAAGIISLIPDGGFSAATPCTDWDVHAVVNHMTNGNLRVAALVTGEAGPDGGDDVLGDVPLADFTQSFEQVCAAFDTDGVLDQVYRAPFGEVPGHVVVTLRAADLAIHAWDLAAATGQPRDLDPELVAFAEGALRARSIPRGEGGPFAPEQPAPPGASAADRMAAFAGRKVPDQSA